MNKINNKGLILLSITIGLFISSCNWNEPNNRIIQVCRNKCADKNFTEWNYTIKVHDTINYRAREKTWE